MLDPSESITEKVDIPSVFGALEDYISCSTLALKACLGQLPNPVSFGDFRATAHFHFVRFNADGDPKVTNLCRELVLHVVRYCFSASARDAVSIKRQGDPDSIEAEMGLQARDYFRKMNSSGEVGELLLFFILEALFKAPQLVAKMELKTNPNDEVKRSDGLHFGWDDKTNKAILYIGESKIYQSIYGALDDAFSSLEKMYDENEREEEIRLITTHFKYISPEFQNAVLQWVDNQLSHDRFRIVHVCLIGYDWNHFDNCKGPSRQDFITNFNDYFIKDCSRLENLTRERLKGTHINHLEFEFIFLPFRSVEEFRNIFLQHLTGISEDTLKLQAEVAALKLEIARLRRKKAS